MGHAIQPATISAEYSLERIIVRLGDDISRLHRQLALLAEEAETPLRADTMALYEEMIAKRRTLLAQVEAELEACSSDYEAIAL